MLAAYETVKKMELPEEAQEKMLLRKTEGLAFFNISKMDLGKLGEAGIKDNLESYVQGFSKSAREIFEYFKFSEFIGLLFLLHLISKMRDAADGGGRIGIILNGSPLFTGAAGSGESEIRRYVLEADLLEAIVALPTDMFYNTGIATYIWVLSNKKAPERKGMVQLINGVHLYGKMRKSLGSKRKQMAL